MPESSFPLSKPSLAYAKLVATPTDTSWSQVYNAGNLFACISLTILEINEEEDISLPRIGKEILDTLHSEFFVLDKKNIASISEVIHKSIHHVPKHITADVSLGFFKDNILYLFLVGHGRVIMKRQGKLGVLLESKQSHKEILTASGYLHNEDTVVLETKQFAEDINDTTLATALDLALPNDIAEALSPQMHEKADGGQAAIIVVYHGVSGGITEAATEDEEKDDDEREMHHEQEDTDEDMEEGDEDDEQNEEEDEADRPRRKKKLSLPKLPTFGLGGLSSKVHAPKGFKLNHTRKLFISIIVILIVLLVGSIFFTKKKEADAKLQQQFQQVYDPALQKYDGAKALYKLNPDQSYEGLVETKKLLSENTDNFQAGSEERKKIDELLANVESELAKASPVQSANAKEVTPAAESLLAVAKANSNGKGFTQDDKAVYFVTDKAIVSVSKTDGKKSDLIKNDSNWEEAIGIATYQGNFYVLDRKKGIVKFVAGGDGYGASSYFKDKPNVSSAKDLAIDSSIWVLLGDGAIWKYTSGASDGFKSPKLEKAMAGPAKIFTDASTSNIYILDRGNSRVVRIAKEGSGHSEYSSGVIRNASDFEVKEKDKKILILSGGKVYEIAI